MDDPHKLDLSPAQVRDHLVDPLVRVGLQLGSENAVIGDDRDRRLEPEQAVFLVEEPPFVGVAVNVTLSLVHTLDTLEERETEAVTREFTVT